MNKYRTINSMESWELLKVLTSGQVITINGMQIKLVDDELLQKVKRYNNDWDLIDTWTPLPSSLCYFLSLTKEPN
jgi:hypothetical protein